MSRSVEIEARAPETPHRSLLLRLMLVPLWAAVAIGVLIMIRAMPGRATKWDYSIYYSSALAMREGMNPYTADLTPLAHSLGFELGKINHATDPPTFVMCFVPLTLLGPRTGFYVWTAINAGRVPDCADPAFSMDSGTRPRCRSRARRARDPFSAGNRSPGLGPEQNAGPSDVRADAAVDGAREGRGGRPDTRVRNPAARVSRCCWSDT